ncbi:MAG: VWA domain-containing protein [Candidatus Sericytochromatia bacterium]|nr:VWA domain-containing protein [Candidatus Tanganyikabacteria bacterium]
MSQPVLNIRPLRAAARTDASVTLEVLVTVDVPAVHTRQPRPPLNLALVLDRSGSMGGEKIAFAREAAACLVRQLAPEDRFSLTLFDDQVEVLQPSTAMADPDPVLEAIRQIRPGGCTHLAGGWEAGRQQVADHRADGALNRILLVSDGQANRGESRVGALGGWAAAAAAEGIGTTTLGVGSDFHEHLLEVMAREGDGHYYFIEDPAQLPGIFAAELSGLTTLVGERASIGLQPGGRAEVLEVMNALDRTPRGGWKLANLRSGARTNVVLRLRVPPLDGQTQVLSVRLAWDEPGTTTRHKLVAKLELEGLDPAAWHRLPEDDEVVRLVALLEASQSKRRVLQHIDRGDRASVAHELEQARRMVMAAPAGADKDAELRGLDALEHDYRAGDDRKLRKRAGAQAYNRERSRD